MSESSTRRLITSEIYQSSAALAIGEAFAPPESVYAFQIMIYMIIFSPNFYGLAKYNERLIISRAFFFTPDIIIPKGLVKKVCDILEKQGTIKRYTCEEKEYYEVLNFSLYNKFRYKGTNTLPAPSWWQEDSPCNITSQCEVKTSEVKTSEVKIKRSSTPASVEVKPVSAYTAIVGLYWQEYEKVYNAKPASLTGVEGSLIKRALKCYEFDMLSEAIRYAFISNDSFIVSVRASPKTLFCKTVMDKLCALVLSYRQATEVKKQDW